MSNNDNTLARGLYYNPPHPKAPAYVKCSLSIQRTNFIAWLNQMEEDAKGYIKIDVLESKGGKIYAKVNEWKPSDQGQHSRKADRPTADANTRRVAEEFGGEVVDQSEDLPF